MSTQQLTQEAIALPLPERVLLAQVLWESIDGGLDDFREEAHQAHHVPCEPEFWDELDRRSREMTDGSVPGIPSEEVMKKARAAIGCA